MWSIHTQLSPFSMLPSVTEVVSRDRVTRGERTDLMGVMGQFGGLFS